MHEALAYGLLTKAYWKRDAWGASVWVLTKAYLKRNA